MNSQQLLQQAIACFNQNNSQQGKQLLQQAANAGSHAAILFYADVLFKEDREYAYQYLGQQWQRGIKGTLHRRALLRRYFDAQLNETSAALIFSDLDAEAQSGCVQSLLALISTLNNNVHSHPYHMLFRAESTELYQQLLSENAADEPVAELLSKQMLQQHFIARLTEARPFNTTVINEEIGLVLAKAALDDIECRYMMLRFSSLLRPSLIVDPATGVARQHPHRSGKMVAIVPEYLDWITLAIEQRIAQFSAMPHRNGEAMNLIHYSVDERYLPHFDAIIGSDKLTQTQLQNGGQRQSTVLCYLNSVEAGGETVFPKINVSVSARAGDMLIFNNVDAKGNLLQASYHAGAPVIAGEKWILSKWIRQGFTDYGTFTYR